jgi:uncharacterized membrane-anchored protein YjiN (DUF445 family)
MEPELTPPEIAQGRALRRNRAVATGLLLLMVAGYAITAAVAAPDFWIGLVHATAEAGVVGGLADWFAVTALFRRPLGLPIPHTAIVPRNKDRIGEGLGRFVERHFLTEDLLLQKLRTIDPATVAARWLAEQANADVVADKLAATLPHVAAALDDEELRAFTARVLGIQLRDVDVAPVVGKILGILTAGGYHAAVLDRGLELLQEIVARNADQIEDAAANDSHRRWWIPKAVNRRIARAIINGVQEVLSDLKTPESGVRRRVLGLIDDAAGEISTSPRYRERLEMVKHELLDRPEIQLWLASMWDQLRDVVLADLAAPSSHTKGAVATALLSLGRALLADESMRGRVNNAIEAALVGFLDFRSEISRFIADVVRRWDQKQLVQRLELALGADLQYVRFTGTLVGASIGCVLYLLPRAVQELAAQLSWPS